MTSSRNFIVDCIRGVAMLLVVLGHTISGSVTEYENSFLFQLIWTLQMPLFIIISGYVTRYSKSIHDVKGLLKFIKKRTLAYLLPWCVWTFIVRGLVFGQSDFFNVKHLLWHMDSGYWFLATIWTISMIYGLADYISNKFSDKKNFVILSHLVLCSGGIIVLAVIGYFAGFTFLAIKYTMYYMPMYLLGYLYGQTQDYILSKKYSGTIINWTICIALVVWLACISHYNYFSNGDGIVAVIHRFTVSILGCISIIGLLSGICNQQGGATTELFRWVGVHSLEIYLSHYLFLNLAQAMTAPILASASGILLLSLNYILTLVITICMIKILQMNSQLNFVLFGKRV